MKTAYQEAQRYMENAKENLKKAGKKDGEYGDVKYVQTGAGVAYNGVLIALDEYLKQKEGNKFTKPKSIEEYRSRVAKQNKSLLKLLNAAYDSLHLAGYYHGTTSSKTITGGMDDAKKIIEFIKPS